MIIAELLGRWSGGERRTPRRTVWLLAVAYGLTIANLYYCQPLLPQMSRSYAASSVGYLPTVVQVGYALALVLVVPLGDIVRRRPLVFLLLLAEAAALVATATAPTAGALLVAGTVIGLAGAGVVNVLVPYAATVAADHERGRAVATMLSGGLVGILLSRTIAGLTAEFFGWRVLYLAAAAVTLLLAAALARVMPPSAAEVPIGYAAQLRATLRLARSEPLLRRRSLIGACVFGAFGVFWTTVAFVLAGPPYRYGEAEIGLFTLVGVAGAFAAKAAGRAADRGWQRPSTGVLLVLGVASFGATAAGAHGLAWLIAGLLVLDVAVHGTHLLNMSVVYGLVDGARSRVASVYMTFYTLGGVAGSAAGAAAYRSGGWAAVSATGAAFMAAGLAVWAGEARGGPRLGGAPAARMPGSFRGGGPRGRRDRGGAGRSGCR
ncbi:MFS transporter [Actinomadura luteofluorescens]|uniref:MFS transporter n=1 Tax=Actinomadura luteofluorescens TaxID=46163 RepID=UPI002164AD17|nr:MFS transporter [Actinomadura glauciflava]MCR3738964.1 putative arabinose efflux permease, MFS family [Actinomadura glauciflava]